mmetsp:Transcript_6284/g.8248  ORF Transcript_6284/g.8248 Transcript_6284/m.8248 type:complete len:374 (+) Transcript_6284:190-1311(+)
MTTVDVKVENGGAAKAELENVNGNMKKVDVKKEESSDDDDIPLSELKRKDSENRSTKIKEEKKDESSDDDDLPLSELKRKDSKKKIKEDKDKEETGIITAADFERRISPRKRQRTQVSYKEAEDGDGEEEKQESGSDDNDDNDNDDDDDDDDDDSSSDDDTMTLAQLKKQVTAKKTPTKTNSTAQKTETKSSSKKKTTARSKTKKKKTTSKSSSKSGTNSKNGPYSWEVQHTLKHDLVEQVLVRWQYCMPKWPQDKEDNEMPSGFIHCGFPGVFMGFRGDVCGEVIDNRSRTGVPSLNALLGRPAKELKELLLVGLAKQKEALVEHKDENSTDVFSETSKALDKQLKEAKKLNPDKIEKDYAKANKTKGKKKR